MAAEIPELVTSNIPVITPYKSVLLTLPPIAPCTRELPKACNWIRLLLHLQRKINGSYKLKPSNIAPTTTNVLKVCAGVI